MSNKRTDFEAGAISDLRLVLVGLNGVGKSAAGNIILGRKEFKSGISCSSLTSEVREGEVCGRRVTVMDTPYLFNTKLSGEGLKKEMERCVSLCEPGPHAFLLVVQLGRFTEQEKSVIEEMQQLFSKRVNQYTMVLFSYGDRLENTTIEEFISNDTNLQKLSEKCGGRYHVFNNKDMENRSQVPELLQKIEKMMEENGGRCFSPSVLSVAEDLRLVLVGLNGVGKSAAGNIILGRKEFKSGISCSSLTLTSEGKGEVCGRRVTVMDTPYLFNTKLSGEGLKKEMERCVSLCEPGPHAFLLVVQLGRFTEQEKRVMEEMQQLFSKKVNQYTMVLFSYGDRLEDTTIEKFIHEDTNLQNLLEKCGGRYHVFNNKDMENHSQVPELLQKIDKMMEENGGCCFSSSVLLSAPEDLRLVLVGLNRVGKSAAGNIILGRKEFKSGISCSSLTVTSEGKGEVCGRRVTVMDTPYLFNTKLSGEGLKKEMERCVSLCEPGPHAFLLVVQLGRFTEQEKRVMEEMQQLFSKKVNRYTMVLFSYGDRLEDTTIEKFIHEDTNLQKLLEKCGGRYHVFNNKDMANHSQVPELLQKIDEMVQKNGRHCYTNDEING